MNILTRITELQGLTSNEKVLVDFILKEPEQTIKSRPNELAAISFVSVATIYRLINKLGLSGFNELKLELISSLKQHDKNEMIDFDYPISESDTPFKIVQNLNTLYAQTIDETMSYFDPESLLEIGNRLYEAKVIDVYAASANLFIAENFKFQMQEIGVNINVPAENYIQELTAANSDSTHVAIVISFGGRSTTTKEVIKILKENQVDIILITATSDNPLAVDAKYKIYFASNENHYDKVSSFSTRLSLLYILDTLYSIYFNKNYDENVKFKLNNYQKINKKLI